MGPPSLPHRRKRLTAEERRAIILEAASEAFAEHGYHGASIEGIARASGVVRSVLYDHFASKRELHVELLEAHAHALVDYAARRVDTTSPEELVRTNVEAFFAFVQRDPFAWRMLFRDAAADPEIAAVHVRIQRETTAALASLFALAPEVRRPPAISREQADYMLAEAVKSTNNALAAWWWEHRDVSRADIAALATDLLWNGLRGLGGDRSLAPRADGADEAG